MSVQMIIQGRMPEGSNVGSWWPSSGASIGAPKTCMPGSDATIGATPSLLSTSIARSLLDHVEQAHH
eukprot:1398877-Ditylum_brightwellii.AAC.1